MEPRRCGTAVSGRERLDARRAMPRASPRRSGRRMGSSWRQPAPMGRPKCGRRRTARSELALKGHTTMVWSVSWSPDGKLLATASADGTAKVWEAVDNRERLTLKAHIRPDEFCRLVARWKASWRRQAMMERQKCGRPTTAGNGSHLKRPCRLRSIRWPGRRTRAFWRRLAPDGHSEGVECDRLPGTTGFQGTRLARRQFGCLGARWRAARDRKLGRDRQGVGRRPTAGSRSALDGLTSGVRCVAWSPDGRWLATASSRRHGESVGSRWRAGERLTLKGHLGEVTSRILVARRAVLGDRQASMEWQSYGMPPPARRCRPFTGHTARCLVVSLVARWETTGDG